MRKVPVPPVLRVLPCTPALASIGCIIHGPARSTWSAASFGRCCASLTEERTDGRSELVVRTHHCTPPFFFFILVNDGERVRPTPAASVRISRVVWGWRRGQSLKISV
ncbi:hypothetical protein SETIT_1G330700v2 [Setaria italica]|uniref:Uncharacterized protein n=1 Tax=Setaria italica TaxID=4555 RepID=A0A368PRT0_SETIT|nr:hypothetical protein SETIT_1G330700v2 [Setaria italica]